MTAQEMFKELGYRRSTDIDVIKYSKKLDDTFYWIEVMFDLLEKEIVLNDNGYEAYIITCDLLKVINKQCQELGWLEEEKPEIKQETNFEHYKDRILDCCINHLAVVKGIPKSCTKIDCNDCDFLTIQKDCHEIAKEWLKHPYIKPVYKLTKFEKELLQCYPYENSFKLFNSLNGMKEKGYFKGIDDNEIIGDILAKCEVIK